MLRKISKIDDWTFRSLNVHFFSKCSVFSTRLKTEKNTPFGRQRNKQVSIFEREGFWKGLQIFTGTPLYTNLKYNWRMSWERERIKNTQILLNICQTFGDFASCRVKCVYVDGRMAIIFTRFLLWFIKV